MEEDVEQDVALVHRILRILVFHQSGRAGIVPPRRIIHGSHVYVNWMSCAKKSRFIVAICPSMSAGVSAGSLPSSARKTMR